MDDKFGPGGSKQALGGNGSDVLTAVSKPAGLDLALRVVQAVMEGTAETALELSKHLEVPLPDIVAVLTDPKFSSQLFRVRRDLAKVEINLTGLRRMQEIIKTGFPSEAIAAFATASKILDDKEKSPAQQQNIYIEQFIKEISSSDLKQLMDGKGNG